MIVATTNEPILKTQAKHIAFPINSSGLIKGGLAEQVMHTVWPTLNFCDEHNLGEVISRQINGRTYYAMVCYDLSDGWDDYQLTTLRDCLKKIDTNGEILAIEDIGRNISESIDGANFGVLLVAMEDANQEIELHTDLELDYIKTTYKENKEKIRRR